MKRLIWILVVVAALGSAYELHSKGMEGAFGGAFSQYSDEVDALGQPLQPSGSLREDSIKGQTGE